MDRLTRFQALILCATFAMASNARANPTTARIAWVVDGDTFRLDGGERIRIAGIDAAETRPRQAKCRQEIAIGVNAMDRARALLSGKTVGIERVGRSYERTVARVTFEGEDLGERLIALGIARPWPRFSPKPAWCDHR